MKKKLLIAGGGYADIPLIIAGKELGFHVITTGNNVTDLGHKYSDEYFQEDFSDYNAMLALSEKLKINAICACSNDFSAISAAYVAEKMGLKGHDSFKTTLLLHHKDSYREFALNNKICSPYAKGFDSIEAALDAVKDFNLPIIIKPIDLTGGKGITKIEHYAKANDAIKKAFSISRAKKIVIEEFIIGSRHGFSTFLQKGKVVFFFSDNEHYYKNPYMVSAASTPSTVNAHIEKKLCAEAEKIAHLLTLQNGIFHIQYILSENIPIIIEICRRSPGDLYTKFVKLATGVDYPLWIVKTSSGLSLNQPLTINPKGFFTRHCIMAEKKGIVSNVSFDYSIKDKIIDSFLWWKQGDYIDDILTEKLGIVFLRFDSMEEMLRITENLPKLIYIEIL